MGEGSAAAVRMESIVKVYPETLNKANDGVDLTLLNGEILSLAGENGAGKSTLMKILYGLTHADGGTISVHGELFHHPSPIEAGKRGIGMVHQHFMLVEEFSVTENVMLGEEPRTALGLLDRKKSRERVSALIEENHFSLSPDALVSSLSVGQKQQVEILKMLMRDVDILILDEPTSVLTQLEIDSLFRTLRKLQQSGVSIILITHKLHEIKDISNRVAVMREGRMVGVWETAALSEEDIARAMMGDTVRDSVQKEERKGEGAPVLRFSHVSLLRHNQDHPLLDDISFSLSRGEILGCAAISGNGLGQIESVLLGNLPVSEGEVLYGDQVLTSAHHTATTRTLGIPFVPSDRLYTGCSLASSVSDNVIATSRKKFFSFFSPKRKEAEDYTASLIEEYQVAAVPSSPIGTLSGGNIQKMILAREIDRIEDLLICCEPTWGLDLNSARFIHRQIVDLRNKGIGILLISSNIDEILALSDRLLIFSRGGICAEFSGEQMNSLTKDMLSPYLLGKKKMEATG